MTWTSMRQAAPGANHRRSFFVAGALLLYASLLVAPAACARPLPPLDISVEVDGWDVISDEPRTWRCARCEPTVVLFLAQRDDAWPDMPGEMRALDGTEFTRRVLADPGQRQGLLEGILRELRRMAPGLQVEASLVGRRAIGGFDFVEARALVRLGGGLIAASVFLTFHKGWLVQLAAMSGVEELPAPVAGEVERFLRAVTVRA